MNIRVDENVIKWVDCYELLEWILSYMNVLCVIFILVEFIVMFCCYVKWGNFSFVVVVFGK